MNGIFICFLILIFVTTLFSMNQLNKDYEENYIHLLDKFVIKNKKCSKSINGMVDAVYCICLPDRKQHMKKQFQKMNINSVIFIDAITPKDLSFFEYLAYSTTYNPGSDIYGKLTKLPVHLSYCLCMYHAMISKYKIIMIFEDDIEFDCSPSDLEKYVEAFYDEPTIDVLYLGYCHLNCKLPTKKINSQMVAISDKAFLLCKHAMIHRTLYFDHFFRTHKKLKGNSDHYFSRYYSHYGIHRAVLNKAVVFQNRYKFLSENDNFNQHLPTCKFNA